MRGYACDNMEDATILLMGDSVEDLDGARVIYLYRCVY
jgi:hypothetical protein